MKKIGLFGGSFDPIHRAHIDIALCALQQLQLDEIQLIPTLHNPWKNQSCASVDDRLAMIDIAIKNYERLSVNPIELNHLTDEKNYTIDTIKALKAQHSDVEYYYIMGMDQANLFHHWKEAEKIAEMVHLVAFQRGGYAPQEELLKSFHFIQLHNEPVNASSSEVRQGHLEMLEPQVLKYISAHGLYLETMTSLYMKEKRWKHTCSVAHLAKEIAQANHLNAQQAYIAGMLHDIAKEMDYDRAYEIMEKHYPQYLQKPVAIWHQWTSCYVAQHDFLVEDPIVLQAIADHTTASLTISPIGKCVYTADKLDPLRGYDSSKQIEQCKQDIHKGFRNSLIEFYEFSIKKKREIDECFYEIYNHFVVKGEN